MGRRVINTLGWSALATAWIGACAEGPSAPTEVQLPTVTAVVPAAVFHGTITNLSVTGTGFAAGSTNLVISGDHATISNVQVSSPTALTATVSVLGSAPIGSRALRVSVAGQLSSPAMFAVLQRPGTTVSGIEPTFAQRDLYTRLLLRGFGFVPDSTSVTISGEGVVLDSLVVESDTSATVRAFVTGAAPLGPREVIATTYGLSSAPTTLSIVPTLAMTKSVIESGIAVDTVNAPAFPLVIELRDTLGRVVPNAQVRFHTPVDSGFALKLRMGAPGSALSVSFNEQESLYVATTDADGLARASVRRGRHTGIHRLHITVPNALVPPDTLLFEVLAGAAHSLRFAAPGLTMQIGDSMTPLVRAHDRHLNPLPVTGLLEAPTGGVASLTAGQALRADAIGNGEVVATLGTLRDTLLLAVVPKWRLLVRRQAVAPGDTNAIMLLDADLSAPRVIVRDTQGPSPLAGAAFDAENARVYFHAGLPENERMFVSDTSGAFSTLLPSAPASLRQFWPQPSPSGAVVFFFGLENHANFNLWRVGTDGSAATRMTQTAGFEQAYHPSPSPDGSHLVYWTSQDDNERLEVRNLLTDSVRIIGPQFARIPRWSPLGGWVLVVDQSRLLAIRPDGTETRILTPYQSYSGPVGASPDDEWAIVRGAERLEIINIHTQQRVLLHGTELLYDPVIIK